jgi:diguanylate cyclase
MTPNNPPRQSRLRPWPCVVGGFLVGSALAVAPLLQFAANADQSLNSLFAGVAICSALLAAGAAFAARSLARPDNQIYRHDFLRSLLLACSAGFVVVAIQSLVLYAHISMTGSGILPVQSIRFPPSRRGELLSITLGASFLFCAALAAVFAGFALRDEQEFRKNEMRWGSAAALDRQHAARWENAILSEQISERRKAEVELASIAQRDALTGLPNRAYLLDALRKELSVPPGSQANAKFLAFIDLDHFRSANDLLGHGAGDHLLKEIGVRLQKCSREDDMIVRLSGDEFAILFQKIATADQAKRTASRILAALEEPVSLKGIRFPVTASLGICAIDARHLRPEDVLRDADTAMYRAKLAGGNGFVFYDSAMYDESLGKIQTTLQLKSAIDNGEFELFYQPFVNMEDNSIYGVEALLRWNHPKRGLLAAGEFIQYVEDAGYSISVGHWALRRACLDFKAIRQAARRDVLVSVNVSSRQLEEPSFIHELKLVLQSCNMDPGSLQLEIVESAFLRDAERIGTLLSAVRDMGVRIALDDFGTGYSALGYLQKFPIDTLKIDQSFVRGMRAGTLSLNIVKFLVNLSESAGMTVLAEGVEDQKHVEALMASGCSHAQGYLYARPVPLPQLLQVLHGGINLPTPRFPGNG